jgi:hypothetical protein
MILLLWFNEINRSDVKIKCQSTANGQRKVIYIQIKLYLVTLETLSHCSLEFKISSDQ